MGKRNEQRKLEKKRLKEAARRGDQAIADVDERLDGGSETLFSKQLGMPGGQDGAVRFGKGRFGKSEQMYQLTAVVQFTTPQGIEAMAPALIEHVLKAVELSGGDRQKVWFEMADGKKENTT